MKRRTYLQLLAMGGAVATLPGLQAAHHRRVEKIGLQLYTVRKQLAEDVHATLAAVAATGYREVETAGTANLTAEQFAAALQQYGLSAPAAHVPIQMLDAQPEALLDMALALGCRYLVVPFLPPEMRTNEGYAGVIDTLNRFGEISAAEGITTCYHNHDFEFASTGGAMPFDVMLANCDRRLVQFELDLFWAAHAGVDAKAYLAADPERFPLCHVKDRTAQGEMTDVGAGVLDFAELFTAGTGLRHYFVEHDNPADALQSIQASYRSLAALRF